MLCYCGEMQPCLQPWGQFLHMLTWPRLGGMFKIQLDFISVKSGLSIQNQLFNSSMLFLLYHFYSLLNWLRHFMCYWNCINSRKVLMSLRFQLMCYRINEQKNPLAGHVLSLGLPVSWSHTVYWSHLMKEQLFIISQSLQLAVTH